MGIGAGIHAAPQSLATTDSPTFAGLTLTGQLLAQASAAASAPAISFTGDTDTGFHNQAANIIQCTTGATERMRIESGFISLGTNMLAFGTAPNARDAALRRTAAGVLEINTGTAGAYRDLRVRSLLRSGENGQYAQITALTESHTLAAAATSDTTIQIPAGAMVLGVDIRVTTEITGCDTLDVGVAGATTRYGTGIALTAGTTNATCATVSAPTIYQSATAIRFSAIGGGASFTAGVVRVTVHLVQISAATS